MFRQKKFYKVRPTLRQKKAIDNYITCQFKSLALTMRNAGYSKSSSYNARHVLLNRRGVQTYLEDLSSEARKRLKAPLEEVVMNVYFGGLTATKGSTGLQPDWIARKAYADRFAFLWGWTSKVR